MENFFAATPKDQLQGVFADAEKVREYPLSAVNRLYDQICFVLKQENLRLMEWKMRYDGACETLEYCIKEQKERRQRKDYSQAQTLALKRHQALSEAEDYKRYRNIILDRLYRLQRLEERVYPSTRWTRMRHTEHVAW